jgi:hypothetical protein
MPNYCQRFKALAYSNDDKSIIPLVRLRCKQWDCEYCAAKNRKIWQAHLIDTLTKKYSERQWSFITLTAASWAREQTKSLANIRGGIEHILKRLKRIAPTMEYVRVFEAHKDGAIHAHLIVCDMPPRLIPTKSKNGKIHFVRWYTPLLKRHSWALKTAIKQMASEVKIGYIADSRPLEQPIYAIGYVVKYMTKDAQALIEQKGLRRIATSRGIGSPQSETDLTWHLSNGITVNDVFLAAQEGKKIVDLSDGAHIVTFDDFEGEINIYPSEWQ